MIKKSQTGQTANDRSLFSKMTPPSNETSKCVLFCDISITVMFILFGIFIICDSIDILMNLFDLDITLSENCDHE